MDLRQPGEFTDDLFAQSQPAIADKVMSVLDEINGRRGKGGLRVASVQVAPSWAGDAPRVDESELYDEVGSVVDGQTQERRR